MSRGGVWTTPALSAEITSGPSPARAAGVPGPPTGRRSLRPRGGISSAQGRTWAVLSQAGRSGRLRSRLLANRCVGVSPVAAN